MQQHETDQTHVGPQHGVLAGSGTDAELWRRVLWIAGLVRVAGRLLCRLALKTYCHSHTGCDKHYINILPEGKMKKIVLLALTIAIVTSIAACSSCPVPPSAPRTYSLNLPEDPVHK